MNKSKFSKLILFVSVFMITMFIVLPLQTNALEQVGFTLEVVNAKLCNSPFYCFGDGEVEYNPNLEAYIVRDQTKTYYAAVRVTVGGCVNTASDTALVLTFDQMTSSFGLTTNRAGFADDKSTAVHGSFTNTLFQNNHCPEGPPYEYKWPNSNQDRGLILDIYENDDRAACACSDTTLCGDPPHSCDNHGYPYQCPSPLQRRDPPHYSTDLGRFSGIRQLSHVERFKTSGTATNTFYVPFNFNVVDGGMSENVHTIKIFAWARMDHYSIPEHVYMWEWNDPGGRIKVHPGCSADKILNTATGKCECPLGQELVDGECTEIRPLCPEGQTRNPDTGECVECYPLGATRPCEGGGTQTCV